MTTVRFYHCKQGKIVGVSACGHSGYAAEGSDIICAAVTVAMNQAADYLTAVAGKCVTVKMSPKPEIVITVASKDPAVCEHCHTYFESMRRVLQESFQGYGEFIQVRDA